jgi:hypothetical protein
MCNKKIGISKIKMIKNNSQNNREKNTATGVDKFIL